MGCFDNIITLSEGCDPATPTSGRYLNDIYINKIEVEQIMTSEYSSAEDFVAQKSAYAVSQVEGEIYSRLSPAYKANSILAGSRVGHSADQKLLVTQSGEIGVEIKMSAPDSYVDFTFSDISVFTDYTGDIEIEFYDVIQGLLLGSVTIASVAGQISQSYEKFTITAPRKSLHIWMGYDATGINSYKTLTHNGCSTCTGFTFSNRFIRATGASIETPYTLAELSSETHTGGISFNYSVSCNYSEWLCNHRAILRDVFLYRTGMEIMSHAKLASLSQRTNTITTTNSELITEKYNFFASQYETRLNLILNNMQVPSDRACFYCDKRISSVFVAP